MKFNTFDGCDVVCCVFVNTTHQRWNNMDYNAIHAGKIKFFVIRSQDNQRLFNCIIDIFIDIGAVRSPVLSNIIIWKQWEGMELYVLMKKVWNNCCALFSCILWCDCVCFAGYVCIDFWVGYVVYHVAVIFVFGFLIVLDTVDDFKGLNATVDDNNYLSSKE